MKVILKQDAIDKFEIEKERLLIWFMIEESNYKNIILKLYNPANKQNSSYSIDWIENKEEVLKHITSKFFSSFDFRFIID